VGGGVPVLPGRDRLDPAPADRHPDSGGLTGFPAFGTRVCTCDRAGVIRSVYIRKLFEGSPEPDP
jgi:hypothetical protein